MNKNRIMMFIFVASEAFFFLGLVISFVYYSRPGGELDASSRQLDVLKTGVFTLFLFASSATLEGAAISLRRGRRRASLAWLAATVALGAAFLVGQGREYVHLAHVSFTVSRNVFGTAFFTLTGFHGLHVLIGLVVLTVVGLMLAGRRYRSVELTVFESAAIYWHFVDAVWVVVFTVVYLGVLV